MKHYLSVALFSLIASLTAFAQIQSIEFENINREAEPIKASGVLVDAEGTFATVALHQANPDKATVLGADGKKVPLELLVHDKISRMTLYKLPKQPFSTAVPVTKFADVAKLKAGDAFTADMANAAKVSRMVSMVRRFNGRILPVTFIRANTENQEIVAGAPVFNEAKELVGLAYQPTVDKESFYILPAKVITHLKASAKFGKLVKPCWIGVSMDHLSDAPRVIGVRPDTPAKAAGMQKGDIVISINDVAVTSYPQVVNAFYFLQRDQPAKFKILRGVEVKELTVTPAVNPIFK